MLRTPQGAPARSGEERKDPMKKRQVRATAAIAATAVAAIATIALAAMAITMNGTRAAARPADDQQAPSSETLTVSPADRTLFDRDLERSHNRRRNHCRNRQHDRQRSSSGGRDGNDNGCNTDSAHSTLSGDTKHCADRQ